MKMNKISAFFLAVSIFLCSFPPARAEGDTITIFNKYEFLIFAKNCTLDSWSQGKTVNLTCDIDMSDTDFSSIPTFGGTFNGNGYTISGINISQSGSDLGLFRYVQQGGRVTNLNVRANLAPSGSKSHIGGIAGENGGSIESCNFEGTVKGENVIGGIAGSNTGSGKIISCTVSGSVTGENSTGGIAGKNEGLISNCVNHAEVNTVYEEKTNELSDIDTDAGAIIETYKSDREKNEEDSVLGRTDTGGIAGYSTGIVQGCTNDAAIGYQHMGYNVGGIAGRQTGYILGCENSGLVQGRKDVGGIVGQAEPYTILSTSQSVIRDVQQELDKLRAMSDDLIRESDTLGDNVEKDLNKISEYTGEAQKQAEILVNESTDFIDANLEELNTQAAIISNTISKMTSVFDGLGSSADNISDAFSDMSSALDSLEGFPEFDGDLKDLKSALDEMSKASKNISKASDRGSLAMEYLYDSVTINDRADTEKALSDISGSISDINTSMQSIKTELETIEKILNSGNLGQIFVNSAEMVASIRKIIQSVETSESSLTAILSGIVVLYENVDFDFYAFRRFVRMTSSAFDYLEIAAGDISSGLSELSSFLDDTDDISDDIDATKDQISTAKEQLRSASDSLSYAMDDVKTAVDGMKEITEEFSDEKPLELVKTSENFKNASEGLFDSFSEISDGINALKDTMNNGENKISGKLRSVNAQLNLVMNLVVGEVDDLQNGGHELSEVFVDVSDEDIANTRQGKIADCKNRGNIQSDRNTGGIAGAMAIEYTKDPEDDIQKPDALRFTYRAKAILTNCINEGEINTKKDCAGGIVGYEEIGTVYKCENYGAVKISNGNYAGGIAGRSGAAIRKCYSKSDIEGNDFVGGIAGKTENLSACYAIATVQGSERVGAIIGMCDSRDNIRGNFFVAHEVGAVDGISYKSCAEPIAFEELVNAPDIPKRMISFKVTFVADDAVVATQDIEYGISSARIKLPDIPPKDGCFGTWVEIEDDTVTKDLEIICTYTPYITILSSTEKDENGKLSLALAEGEFTDKAELHINKSDAAPPKSVMGNSEVYDISLKNTDITGNDPVTVRILNENRDSVTAWILQDNNWEEIEVRSRGKYVILDTVGPDSTICLQYTKRNFVPVLIGVIVFILIGVAISVATKKNGGKRKSEESDSESD